MLDATDDPPPHGVSALKRRLAAIRAQQPEVEPKMITEVVRAVLTTMSHDLTAKEATLLHEVEELARTIATAKSEIAELRVDEITGHHIPSATDELDAIVEHTAIATNSILESCEAVDEVSSAVGGESAAKLQAAVTKIYEACSFQDITGQRITKVVNTLKTIEEKVAHIIGAFGPSAALSGGGESRIATDADLLNGPQLAAHAMDQSDIDKLLADF
jgi:chemotaxis protein CheZ